MTIATLADQYGELSSKIKALQEEQDAIKKQLLAYKSDKFVGTRYTITRTTFESSRLDTAAIRAEHGENWLAMYSKPVTTTRLNVSLTHRMDNAA